MTWPDLDACLILFINQLLLNIGILGLTSIPIEKPISSDRKISSGFKPVTGKSRLYSLALHQ